MRHYRDKGVWYKSQIGYGGNILEKDPESACMGNGEHFILDVERDLQTLYKGIFYKVAGLEERLASSVVILSHSSIEEYVRKRVYSVSPHIDFIVKTHLPIFTNRKSENESLFLR